MPEECRECPRNCGIVRKKQKGFCGVGEKPILARVGFHQWEEPCISYGKGSGTIFFSGCNLRCVFCQNHQISQGMQGKEISPEILAEEIISLQEQGAVNINLVTPSHNIDVIAKVLAEIKPKLLIPIIYNSSGYDKVESLRKLVGLIDIYLPDIKYYSSDLSQKYSGAKDYFDFAQKAIAEMFRQCGYYQEEDGHMSRGVLVRHMVLPGCYRDSVQILDWLSRHYDTEKMAISLMSQYTPMYLASEYPEINRRLTTFEYKKVVEHACDLGFVKGFIQKRESASTGYIPQFDY